MKKIFLQSNSKIIQNRLLHENTTVARVSLRLSRNLRQVTSLQASRLIILFNTLPPSFISTSFTLSLR
jgi:hypothetical protein